jgi:hypothetical protein
MAQMKISKGYNEPASFVVGLAGAPVPDWGGAE